MAGSYRTMLLSCLFLTLFSAARAAIPPCNPGTYSDQGYMPCTQCPAGTFASNYGTRSCTAVPAGYASCPAGQSSCIGSNTLYPCALGTYASVAGSTSCTVCPAGYSCANVAREPVACPAGTYSPSGARSCTTCPQGTTSTSGSASCTQITCGAGSYLDTLTSTCVTCQPGTFLSSTTLTCAACPAGHSCAGADAVAVECPSGTFSQAGQSTCIACDTDTVSSAGSSSCTFCPTGTTANADKSACVAPTVCGPGAYPNGDDCLLCSPGYYCPGSNSAPLECPANTWSEGGDSYCSDCGNGFTSVAGSAECTELACTIGYYPDGHTCSLCPAGSYCPNPAGSPSPCAAGTYAPAGAAECLSCPTGYTSAEGATFCVVEEEPSCGDGFYMDQGTCSICPAGSACSDNLLTQCAAGTYSEENAAACTPCANGYTSDAGAAQCTPEAPACTAGEYLDTMSSTCKTCPAGFACPSPDSNAIQGCLAGTFSFAGQTRCTECVPGTTSAALASSCTPILPVCSAGQYTAAGNLCTTCPAGYACPDPSASAPTACTPGTYSTGGQTSCTACPGPTISEAAASSCHVAPAQPSGGLTKRNEPLGLRALCAFGSRRCPVPGLMMGLGYTAAYECVDVRNDLESCGGCVYNDSPNGEVNENGGRDCSAIPGVESVRCVRGMCVVDSCRRGSFVGGRSASCEVN